MNFEWVARRGGTDSWLCAASSDGMVNWGKKYFEWVARRGGTACRICAASSDGMVNWEKWKFEWGGRFLET